MVEKCAAIVLGSVKYGDNSIILKTYTRSGGLKSFIAGSIHSKKGVLKPAMLQVLSQMDLVYYERSKGALKRVKEASVSYHYKSLWYDPVKSTLAMFLAEILSHVLKEEEENPALFEYIIQSMHLLDEVEEGVGNFHLHFLLRLTAYLGFFPQSSGPNARYFDLESGVYVSGPISHYHFLSERDTGLWKQLQQSEAEGELKMGIGRSDRSMLLNSLLTYYRLHITDFGELKSLEVLKSLLS